MQTLARIVNNPAVELFPTDAASALEAAAAESDTIVVREAVAPEPAGMGALANTTFRGPGSLTGVYRKAVIPDNAPSDALVMTDVVAERMLRQLNAVTKPTVILVGDSISTYFANSVGRADLLADSLRASIENQIGPITFYNRAIGGAMFTGVMGAVGSRPLPMWYSDPAKTWISYVKDLAPDLVILSFGMNDNASISVAAVQAVVDEIQSWTKVPDIVFATNLVPSMSDSAYQDGTNFSQESRDMSAGWVRTYAKFHGFGLLDFHRKCCMVRDGFDPCSSVLARGDTVTATVAGAQQTASGSRAVYDFKARLKIDSTAWTTDGGDYITVSLGTGSADFMQILKQDATHLHFVLYTGNGSDATAYFGTVVTCAIPSGTDYWLTVERFGNRVTVYYDLDTWGANWEPLVDTKIIARGGLYTPTITSNNGPKLVAVDFSYGEPRLNVPSVTDRLLWGDGAEPIDVHGGSGWNHPGGFSASHIYRPVLDGVRWGSRKSPQHGSKYAGVGTPAVTVTFAEEEPDANYFIGLEFVGDPGNRWYTQSKTTTGFQIKLSGSSGGSFTMNWWLVRP